MRFILLLVLLLTTKNIIALELSCLFEEVHQNGDIEQGVFIAKGDKFRYQYFSKNLLTIIHKDKLFIYLQNSDTTKYFKIDKNTSALEAIVKIVSDFPNIQKEYYLNETLIKVEISKVSKFPKRIIILSENLNMSIYVNECKTIVLDDKYFLFSPFWDYKY
tara:strand:- start:43 stop:525 length:483 start_codon:yes stop_codon:yes gene_type:complete